MFDARSRFKVVRTSPSCSQTGHFRNQSLASFHLRNRAAARSRSSRLSRRLVGPRIKLCLCARCTSPQCLLGRGPQHLAVERSDLAAPHACLPARPCTLPIDPVLLEPVIDKLPRYACQFGRLPRCEHATRQQRQCRRSRFFVLFHFTNVKPQLPARNALPRAAPNDGHSTNPYKRPITELFLLSALRAIRHKRITPRAPHYARAFLPQRARERGPRRSATREDVPSA
jgi:hypothetical protein